MIDTGRLRAWADDMALGRQCQGADYDVRQAALEIDAMRSALKLALEYWAHRQQRYKNRHPAWVFAAKDALL
jgi:hypothetical protein